MSESKVVKALEFIAEHDGAYIREEALNAIPIAIAEHAVVQIARRIYRCEVRPDDQLTLGDALRKLDEAEKK